MADSNHACKRCSFICVSDLPQKKRQKKKLNEIVEYGKVMWRFSPSSHKIHFFPFFSVDIIFVCAVNKRTHAILYRQPTLHFQYGVCVHEMSVPQPNEPFETYNFLFGAVSYRCTLPSTRHPVMESLLPFISH